LYVPDGFIGWKAAVGAIVDDAVTKGRDEIHALKGTVVAEF
jgi:hypothetical protein